MSDDSANIYESNASKLPTELERLRSFDLPFQMSLEAIGPIQPGTRFLDIGAGPNTDLLRHVVSQGGVYTALDKNTEFLEEQKQAGASVVEGDVRDIHVGDGTADVAHARFVIAHLGKDKQRAIKEVVRTVGPSGRAIFIDYDWTNAHGTEEFDRVKDFMINGGFLFDADFGAQLEKEVRACGLQGTIDVKSYPPTQMVDYSQVLNMRGAGIQDLSQQGKDSSIAEWESMLDKLKAESETADPPGFYFPGSKIVTLTKSKI